MPFDYSKLLGRIKEKYKTQENFADKIGLSQRTVSLKLNNKREWKQIEIDKACDILEIPDSDIREYFFCSKCSK